MKLLQDKKITRCPRCRKDAMINLSYALSCMLCSFRLEKIEEQKKVS